jgi:hypothetical protein
MVLMFAILIMIGRKNTTNELINNKTMDKEYIHLSTKETFTINGCGKFESEKKHLSRTEAMLLYVKLHTWLMEDKKQ